MHSLRTSAAAALLGATLAAAVPADYPIAFPQPGLSVLNTGVNGGFNALPYPAWEATPWDWGTLPKVCHEAATEKKYCDVYDVEVYNLKTADCHQPWVVCRCKTSPFAAEKLFQRIAQVPVQARQYVRFWQSYPGGGAFSLSSDITLMGDHSEGMTVFFHETSHNLDYWVAGGQGGGSFSEGFEWNTVINIDTCAADDYGKSTNTEEYAQIGVLSAYHSNVGDVFAGRELECLRGQFDLVHEQLKATWTYGANQTCTVRLNEHDSPPVCMGDKAKEQGACASIAEKGQVATRGIEARYPGIEVLNVPRSAAPSEAEAYDMVNADLLPGRKRRFAA